MRHRGGWMLGLCLALVAPLMAQDVPPPLRDWQGWALHDVPQHACPFPATEQPRTDNRACIWPGRLQLTADATGGQFRLDVHVDAPGWVALPGDAPSWPQQVSANQQSVPVLQHAGQPMLWLVPGDYQLRGDLPWTARPAQLRVPAVIGLVTLSVDGADVANIERHGNQLTLGEATAARRASDALALRVYRRLGDGLPAPLATQLQFNVAGSARELVLGPVLPAGFVATALSGPLPARLEPDGRLRVQLRPGQWTLTLDARAVAPLAKVALQLPAAPWPRQETWSYADAPALRATRVVGQATDAERAGVPEDWQSLPAFVMDGSRGLVIEPGPRGDEGGKGDQLHLSRQLWLDFDGRGLSVVDHLRGDLRQQQRLDVAAPWQLQRASQSDVPLLISRGAAGQGGVEVRTRALDLDAGLRLEAHSGAIPSAGWKLPLESIDASLHLPSGYRLLGTTGVDRSPDSWVAQWSLLDLFVLALAALLAGRALGWPWAALAAAYLALAQHEDGAPLWTLALALALVLLLRALPAGRLRVAARTGAIAMLALAVLWSLPFAATQLQLALHPQLESAVTRRVVVAQANTPAAPMAAQKREMAESAALPPPPAPPAAPAPVVTTVDALAAATPSFAATRDNPGADLDMRNVTQAGAGMPQWDQGNTYRLAWSGPVTAQQSMRLVIAPAWLVRLLRVLMVGLLALLLARLLPGLLPPQQPLVARWRRFGGAMTGGALLAIALLPGAGHAQDLPDQQLLRQLQARLTEAPPCAPACAALAQAQVAATGDTLEVTLQAHTGAGVAMALPRPDDGLQLQSIDVDGQAAAPLRRQGDRLLVRLERGVHSIHLRYRIGAVDRASLGFALRPQRVTFVGRGWSLAGVDAGRLLGDSLAVQRQRVADSGQGRPLVQGFPPYVRLTRRLRLGVDWTVDNTVTRIAPREGGFSLSLPLLPGEHPQGEGVLVKDGRIDITFGANVDTLRWRSRLDHTVALSLHAPALGERAEVWEVHAAPMWHVDARGVPASALDDGLGYRPLPGETLQLDFSQPVAVAGDSLAFDGVRLTARSGERATETTLELRARSTRGGEHAIAVPVDAELLDASRDGAPVHLALRDGKLGLPLLPGTHDYALRLRQRQGVATRTVTPTFDLRAAAANVDLALQLPHDRWVLWTWGPVSGPAVLYWSQLGVLILAAWLLARFAPTPLRMRQWLLLGLGFSAFAWSAYALVVAWLIALGWRARHVPGTHWPALRFNLLQCALAVLTLLALLVLVGAVPKGLLGLPDMHVAGHASTAWDLHWFADRNHGTLPVGGVFSVSLWFYKLAMLAWALWLANALLGWMRWALAAWTAGGYWRQRQATPVAPPPLPSAVTPKAARDD